MIARIRARRRWVEFVDNVSQVCNDQRIALILSLERGAASSYLSSSERSLPRLLHLSYSCTIEAVQQPQYSRTAVRPSALQPSSRRTLVRRSLTIVNRL